MSSLENKNVVYGDKTYLLSQFDAITAMAVMPIFKRLSDHLSGADILSIDEFKNTLLKVFIDNPNISMKQKNSDGVDKRVRITSIFDLPSDGNDLISFINELIEFNYGAGDSTSGNEEKK